MIRPPRLQPGARVAVVAPAGPVPREAFAAGVAILGTRYRVVHGERIFARTGFLAGGDDERAAELAAALADPDVDAVICARGGYGLTRIVDGLDPAPFVRAPKPIVGFSDVTALLAWAARAGVIGVHGPVVTQLGTLAEEDGAALLALLESPAPPPPLVGLRTVAGAGSVAEGRLLGGNLELVTRLIGTPLALALDGAVLLLEEIGERPYRIDRQLTHLLASGALARVAAVVMGDLVACVERDGSGPDAAEVVSERLGRLGVPVLMGAPIGHGKRNRAVPHGARVRVDGRAGSVEWLEGAVR
jgi:muramoyltetrapeptide carboxypeptidase